MKRSILLPNLAVVGAMIFASPASSDSHDQEIRAFAAVMAIAQTASDRCSDILVSNAMLDKAPGFFHIAPEDQAAYRAAAGIEMARLAAAIQAAPSLKAWCDEAYRAYGPNGDVMRDLFAR